MPVSERERERVTEDDVEAQGTESVNTWEANVREEK